MNVPERLAAVARCLDDRFGEVEVGTMLRSEGIRTRGRFFAIGRTDELVVKLPEPTARRLVVTGAAQHFRSGGRDLREWVAVPAPDPLVLLELVVAAHAYVRDGHGALSYASTAAGRVTPAALHRALTTAEGIAGWWTSGITGSPGAVGGSFELTFRGLDEEIRMEVLDLDPDRAVSWRCTRNTGHPEWVGTTIEFALVPGGDGASAIRLHHEGLRAALSCFEVCRGGWERFLASIVAFAETGVGHPFAPAAP